MQQTIVPAAPPAVSPVSTPATAVRRALAYVTSLFFLWGLAWGLLDVLNKHFQETLGLSLGKSGFLQAAFFLGYFTAAIPVSYVTRRLGYKGGIIAGLLLYGGGALLFVPASYMMSFPMFLFALYVIACGLACLETSSNPYVVVLGKPDDAAHRLNFSQAFYGVGSLCGPMIGGLLFFGNVGSEDRTLTTLRLTYIGVAAVVAVVTILIASTSLPDIPGDGIEDKSALAGRSVAPPRTRLRDFPSYWAGVATIFIGLAGQVGVATFFINFATKASASVNSRDAAFMLSVGMGLLTIGRFVSPLMMKRASPGQLLSLYSTIFVVLIGIGIVSSGMIAIGAVLLSFFFTSTLFPTVFALSLSGLGHLTKRGASMLVMAVCGCGILPVIMGHIADVHGIALSYLLPLACFCVPIWFGLWGSKLKPRVLG